MAGARDGSIAHGVYGELLRGGIRARQPEAVAWRRARPEQADVQGNFRLFDCGKKCLDGTKLTRGLGRNNGGQSCEEEGKRESRTFALALPGMCRRVRLLCSCRLTPSHIDGGGNNALSAILWPTRVYGEFLKKKNRSYGGFGTCPLHNR